MNRISVSRRCFVGLSARDSNQPSQDGDLVGWQLEERLSDGETRQRSGLYAW
jgi:hypothetical protein